MRKTKLYAHWTSALERNLVNKFLYWLDGACAHPKTTHCSWLFKPSSTHFSSFSRNTSVGFLFFPVCAISQKYGSADLKQAEKPVVPVQPYGRHLWINCFCLVFLVLQSPKQELPKVLLSSFPLLSSAALSWHYIIPCLMSAYTFKFIAEQRFNWLSCQIHSYTSIKE